MLSGTILWEIDRFRICNSYDNRETFTHIRIKSVWSLEVEWERAQVLSEIHNPQDNRQFSVLLHKKKLIVRSIISCRRY